MAQQGSLPTDEGWLYEQLSGNIKTYIATSLYYKETSDMADRDLPEEAQLIHAIVFVNGGSVQHAQNVVNSQLGPLVGDSSVVPPLQGAHNSYQQKCIRLILAAKQILAANQLLKPQKEIAKGLIGAVAEHAQQQLNSIPNLQMMSQRYAFHKLHPHWIVHLSKIHGKELWLPCPAFNLWIPVLVVLFRAHPNKQSEGEFPDFSRPRVEIPLGFVHEHYDTIVRLAAAPATAQQLAIGVIPEAYLRQPRPPTTPLQDPQEVNVHSNYRPSTGRRRMERPPQPPMPFPLESPVPPFQSPMRSASDRSLLQRGLPGRHATMQRSLSERFAPQLQQRRRPLLPPRSTSQSSHGQILEAISGLSLDMVAETQQAEEGRRQAEEGRRQAEDGRRLTALRNNQTRNKAIEGLLSLLPGQHGQFNLHDQGNDDEDQYGDQFRKNLEAPSFSHSGFYGEEDDEEGYALQPRYKDQYGNQSGDNLEAPRFSHSGFYGEEDDEEGNEFNSTTARRKPPPTFNATATASANSKLQATRARRTTFDATATALPQGSIPGTDEAASASPRMLFQTTNNASGSPSLNGPVAPSTASTAQAKSPIPMSFGTTNNFAKRESWFPSLNMPVASSTASTAAAKSPPKPFGTTDSASSYQEPPAPSMKSPPISVAFGTANHSAPTMGGGFGFAPVAASTTSTAEAKSPPISMAVGTTNNNNAPTPGGGFGFAPVAASTTSTTTTDGKPAATTPPSFGIFSATANSVFLGTANITTTQINAGFSTTANSATPPSFGGFSTTGTGATTQINTGKSPPHSGFALPTTDATTPTKDAPAAFGGRTPWPLSLNGPSSIPLAGIPEKQGPNMQPSSTPQVVVPVEQGPNMQHPSTPQAGIPVESIKTTNDDELCAEILKTFEKGDLYVASKTFMNNQLVLTQASKRSIGQAALSKMDDQLVVEFFFPGALEGTAADDATQPQADDATQPQAETFLQDGSVLDSNKIPTQPVMNDPGVSNQSDTSDSVPPKATASSLGFKGEAPVRGTNSGSSLNTNGKSVLDGSVATTTTHSTAAQSRVPGGQGLLSTQEITQMQQPSQPAGQVQPLELSSTSEPTSRSWTSLIDNTGEANAPKSVFRPYFGGERMNGKYRRLNPNHSSNTTNANDTGELTREEVRLKNLESIGPPGESAVSKEPSQASDSVPVETVTSRSAQAQEMKERLLAALALTQGKEAALLTLITDARAATDDALLALITAALSEGVAAGEELFETAQVAGTDTVNALFDVAYANDPQLGVQLSRYLPVIDSPSDDEFFKEIEATSATDAKIDDCAASAMASKDYIDNDATVITKNPFGKENPEKIDVDNDATAGGTSVKVDNTKNPFGKENPDTGANLDSVETETGLSNETQSGSHRQSMDPYNGSLPKDSGWGDLSGKGKAPTKVKEHRTSFNFTASAVSRPSTVLGGSNTQSFNLTAPAIPRPFTFGGSNTQDPVNVQPAEEQVSVPNSKGSVQPVQSREVEVATVLSEDDGGSPLQGIMLVQQHNNEQEPVEEFVPAPEEEAEEARDKAPQAVETLEGAVDEQGPQDAQEPVEEVVPSPEEEAEEERKKAPQVVETLEGAVDQGLQDVVQEPVEEVVPSPEEGPEAERNQKAPQAVQPLGGGVDQGAQDECAFYEPEIQWNPVGSDVVIFQESHPHNLQPGHCTKRRGPIYDVQLASGVQTTVRGKQAMRPRAKN